jgi:hypothetical protein
MSEIIAWYHNGLSEFPDDISKSDTSGSSIWLWDEHNDAPEHDVWDGSRGVDLLNEVDQFVPKGWIWVVFFLCQ